VRMTGTFPQLLHAFFYDWLAGQRNNSAHTVRSYRDTWRLFLRFVATRHNRLVAALRLADFTAAEVLAFLEHSEQERHVSVGTRNCRLAALRSFFSFVADREPLAAAQCAAVLRIPIKRGPHRDRCYLESTELQAILAAPDRKTLEGQRDHALLALLYNTGARIQEALDLCPKAVRLESPGQVRLMGKGRKERLCPIWPETAALLAALLQRQPRAPDEPIFINRYGRPLGASGFRFQLRQYVQMAAKKVPALSDKRISPHTLRHSAAVHLVAAGVDLTVIRSWMGHAHLDTTNLYAQANLETKRRALERIDAGARPEKPPPWKQDDDALSWLDSL
jgi:site-specific recombinase XerD